MEDKYRPSVEELTEELHRITYRRKFSRVLRSTIYTLIIVAAIAVLVATLWMPVLEITGNSMTPTLEEGNIVISLKGTNAKVGELISFYYNNKILTKRVIAGPSDWVDMDEEGNVSVNGKLLDEPYVSEKALGDCDVRFPYQVPDEKYFVMGDHRETSVDSRSTQIGCVSEEQIVGRIVFRIWPLDRFGILR